MIALAAAVFLQSEHVQDHSHMDPPPTPIGRVAPAPVPHLIKHRVQRLVHRAQADLPYYAWFQLFEQLARS